MLQCQNYILADQVSTFQSVAKKASVEVKLNYQQQCGTAKLTKRKFIWQKLKQG